MYHGPRGMVGRQAIQAARPELGAAWDAVDASFPVRVTAAFAAAADLADPTDPLARQVLPDPAELFDDGLDDPVGEKAHAPMPWLVRKYPDRALLMVTKRCHLYCRYCFRRTHAPGEALEPTPQELDAAVDWLHGQPDLREVILSGGDPLFLKDPQLFTLIDRLQPRFRVRVHSRAPITYPRRVTSDLADGLASRRAILVVHCNHPRELTDDVHTALSCLVDRGVVVCNQAVLLAGVNDDPDVLVELFEQLTRNRVRPYYLHHPDHVKGNAHFRLTQQRGRALFEEVKQRLGGMALPRYVWDPPNGSGKQEV